MSNWRYIPKQVIKWVRWWLVSSVQHLNITRWQITAAALLYLVPLLMRMAPADLMSPHYQNASQIFMSLGSVLCAVFFGGYGLLIGSAANVANFVLLLRMLPHSAHATSTIMAALIAFTQIVTVLVYVVCQRLRVKMGEEHELTEKLRESNQTDELTGVYNYRYFRQRLAVEIDRADRNGDSCTLLIADVDQFKHYNDANGHLAGDRALVQLTGKLKAKIRASDIIARIGGEEFAVILPDTSVAQSQKIARRLARSIAEHQFPGEENQPGGSLTISVGLSIYPDWAEDINSLLTQADDAMYHAKHKAGNRAEIYSNVLENLAEDIDGEEIVLGAFRTLLGIISARDNYTYGHSQRVAEYSVAIARRLDLTEDQMKILRWSALFHDLGKIDVPEWVLNKRGSLSTQEWDYIYRHPEKSADILRPVSQGLQPVVEVVRSHHERIDGEGYPQGLKDDDIPQEARVLAVADAIDAMRSVRPYRDARDDKKIAHELVQNGGKQFDEDIATLAAEMLESGSF